MIRAKGFHFSSGVMMGDSKLQFFFIVFLGIHIMERENVISRDHHLEIHGIINLMLWMYFLNTEKTNKPEVDGSWGKITLRHHSKESNSIGSWFSIFEYQTLVLVLYELSVFNSLIPAKRIVLAVKSIFTTCVILSPNRLLLIFKRWTSIQFSVPRWESNPLEYQCLTK